MTSNTSQIPAAVIFDADGTLYDSFEMIMSAYGHVAMSHNLRTPSAEEIRSQLGNSLPNIFKSLYPGHDIETLLHTNNEFVAANVMKSEVFEGLHDMLRQLQASGYKIAILTSGSQKIHDILMHHEITDFFDSVVTHERVENPKPDPEGFILAAAECVVDPHTAIMVGDMPNDILAGKNAGAFKTIAVSHGYGARNDLINVKADYIFDNLHDVTSQLIKLRSSESAN